MHATKQLAVNFNQRVIVDGHPQKHYMIVYLVKDQISDKTTRP